jgi:aerobic-type carbon monoxide dehydrogenase small subunit (CoxS/CutS family)
MIELTVNGEKRTVDVPSDTPLLWVLREELGLTGTKFGCGIAQCGACTVHVNGEPVRACVTPVGEVDRKAILTIEGVARGEALHPLQQAWIDEGVPQCGYCQSGQIMSALCLLKKVAKPTDQDIDAVLSSNLCRCGTYVRIRRAVHRAAAVMSEKAPASPPDHAPGAEPQGAK